MNAAFDLIFKIGKISIMSFLFFQLSLDIRWGSSAW